MVKDLQGFQNDCVDAFRMEFSREDIKTNSDIKRLARYINRQGQKIDKIIKLQRKVMCY